MSEYPQEWPDIAAKVKKDAGERCVRCRHRADNAWKTGARIGGIPVMCDDECDLTRHAAYENVNRLAIHAGRYPPKEMPYAPQRVLTVHHLDGDKANVRWWNLVALCQVCHLHVQGRVIMDRPWMFEHSEWFHPYVAGYYAFITLGEDLTRDQVTVRLDELLAIGLPS